MTRPQRLTLWILSILIAVTRFVPLARAPWDWDEVLFCLAMRDYDVGTHHPHPPGFPLFIALANLVRFFTSSDFRALQTVNVVASFFVFPLMFAMARAFRFSYRTSLVAAILFAFLPNVWLYGGTAFSDMAALVLFMLATVLFVDSAPGKALDRRRYWLAAFVLGLASLIRPQNALVLIYPWIAAAARFVRAKQYRVIILGIVITVLVAVIGYGAAMMATGPDRFIGALLGHKDFVARTDTLQNPARPPLGTIVRMQLDPYVAGKVSILINLFVLLGMLRGPRRSTIEILLTFAPFFLFMTFILSHLGFSRLSLSYSPGVVMLAAEGMFAAGVLASRVIRWKPEAIQTGVAAAALALILGRLIWWTLPAFDEPRRTLAPPTATVLWIRQHVPKRTTLYVDEGMWPWARYYLPEYKQIRVPGLRAKDVVDWREGWFIRPGNSGSVGAVPFRRPHNRTWNVVAQRYFETYAIPVAEHVYFGKGWYDEESFAEEAWRWMEPEATALLPPVGPNGELVMAFTVPTHELKKPIRVTFELNGEPLGDVVCRVPTNDVRFVALNGRTGRPNVLRMTVSDRMIAEGDPRPLALQLHAYGWKPLQ
ncbi:MAG TPA: hypothetical protein VGF69_15950 [Thermoanaerobaculia bacterium]